MNSDISYKGVVKLRQLRGNKCIRTYTFNNTATVWFFQQIALAMTGKEDALSNMPKYIDIVTSSENESILAHRVAITARRVTTNGTSASAQFDAYIPAVIMTKPLESDQKIQLHSQYTSAGGESLLASIEVTINESFEVSRNYSYQVSWKTTISNGNEETE